MNQRTAAGVTLLDLAKGAVVQYVRARRAVLRQLKERTILPQLSDNNPVGSNTTKVSARPHSRSALQPPNTIHVPFGLNATRTMSLEPPSE
jgi:hypothetical protein